MTAPRKPGAPKRGLFIAPFDALADPLVLGEFAASAEAAGWDGLFLWDHIRYRPPAHAVLDPWIGLAVVAMSTERLLLGPMVTPLPRRRVQVVARQAAALDLLSRGRLVLGFGLGGDDYGEFSRYGDEPDPRVRGAMLDEGLEVLTALLTGGPVEFEGAYLTARDPGFLPAPTRRIPIWIAGRHPNAAPLRRAARFDGYFPIDVRSPDAVQEIAGRLGDLSGHGVARELVIELPDAVDPSAWLATDATWLLTTIGPFDIDIGRARSIVAAGPADRPSGLSADAGTSQPRPDPRIIRCATK